MNTSTSTLHSSLKTLANKYETPEFINGDPSWFMHQVEGQLNQETLAFIASSLSYGSRKQFLPKIQYILDCANGEVYEWVKSGQFEHDIPDDDKRCYYRLYTYSTMNRFLRALQKMLQEHGSLKEFARKAGKCDNGKLECFAVIETFCNYFSEQGVEVIIPKSTSSACKRVCMFLRWMVRDNSPVDLGLWSDIIDKRTLIMPLDTHVVQESVALGLLTSNSSSMAAAKKLTAKMLEIFPDDPLKGDFALFGYGVDTEK